MRGTEDPETLLDMRFLKPGIYYIFQFREATGLENFVKAYLYTLLINIVP